MIPERVKQELRGIVGEKWVRDEPEDLLCYAYDATYREHLPDLVVSPANTEEVAGVLRVAWREELPVVPRGLGSGLAGGSIPIQGGLVLNLTRMNRILEIDRVNMVAVVEAGVVTADLQAEVAR
ncbi:MAG: FAD-binding oxidoreductase, partial [Chloroflexia bacterium]